jgi:DNA polymerase III alpha subunit
MKPAAGCTPEHDFKTRAAMLELFKDLPEALANTVEIAHALQLPPAHAKARSCRASPRRDGGEGMTKPQACVRMAQEGLGPAGSPRHGDSAGPRARRSTATGWISSSPSSSG